MLFFVLKRTIFALILCLLSACSPSVPEPPKQTLRLNIFTEPPTLDSRKATDSTSMNVLLNLFEGLTRIGEDHRPQPAVAERIEISSDGRIYTFYLRDCLWTNGDRVTAEDFLYAWQSILDPLFPSLFAYKLYVIENAEKIKAGKLPLESLGVRALNPKTLQVTLKYPTPYFLELAAFPTFYPVNHKAAKKNAEWAAEAGVDYISNGPFKLIRWDHENEIELVKNSFYWDADAVKLDALRLAMIDDTTTEFYMFEMNELDWAGSPLSNLPPEFIAALKAEGAKGGLPVNFYPATAVYYYKINTQHYPLSNRSIRNALAYAINRQEIVEHITQAGQIPAMGLVPPMPGWDKASELFEDGNSDLAKKLFSQGLEELGIRVEQFPAFTLCFNTNREHQKIAQAIQHQWKDILGIEVNLQHFDWKVYLSKISNQDYDIGRMGWIGDFHDPVSFLEPFKFKNDPDTGGNNDTGWENPDYIAYLEQAEKELDLSKRAQLLRKAEALLIAEMPVIPIYYIVNGYLKKPYVHGVYLSPLGTADFKKAYLTRKDP
jgi:oligopeptide transport system substrate-binding protein